MGISPRHGSHAALPIACDALNARTVAVRKYHCIFCAVVARKPLHLLSGAVLVARLSGRGYRITKLLESALFYKLPAIRFHILTPFFVGKLVVLPPFRWAILPFEKNAEDFRNFFKKIFEQQNTPVRKARTGVWVLKAVFR